jgi:group I intron endonuclease
MNKDYCIYKHQCKLNGQIYIGQTCQNISRRWRNGEGYKQNIYFYSAIQKYGWENFTHEILETNLNREEANEKEKYWIKYYKSNQKGYGYNLTDGGENIIYSQLSKDKMSKSAIKRFENTEEREKQSLRLKEAYKQDESRWDIIKKPVECLETGEKFKSTTLAAKWAGIKSLSSFGNYFRGESKSCGKHPLTGKRLHWRRLTKEEVEELNG